MPYEVVLYLINWKVHLQVAVFLHLCCSCHLTSAVLCIEHTALWEKWLITISSCAGSHHLVFPLSGSLHPSLPSCPLPLLFLFNFTWDQCFCQAIYLFRVIPQMKGPQKATAAGHKYGQPAWTFGLGLVTDSDRLLLMHVCNNFTFFFLVKKLEAAGSDTGQNVNN